MTITQERSSVAYCECGARLAGGSESELFAAAERHIADHHAELLTVGGAVSPGTGGGCPNCDGWTRTEMGALSRAGGDCARLL